MNHWRLLMMIPLLLGARLVAGADDAAALADFKARCAAPGVLKCVGFDVDDDFSAGQVGPAADGRVRAAMDGSVRASGAGSLRFEIPSRSPPNSSGYWLDSLGGKFGQGSTFYFQFRQRFSRALLETHYQEQAGWKQFIVYQAGPSCTSVQLVMLNQYLRGLPTLYTACGSNNLNVELPDGDHLLQQGDYRCHRRDPQPGRCAIYVADRWMTFSFQVDVGTFGKPDSRVLAWVAAEGEPLRQFIDFPGLVLDYEDSPGEGFNRIQFTPYHTDKDHRQEHPVAYTWYDELIVAWKPIAAPAANRAR